MNGLIYVIHHQRTTWMLDVSEAGAKRIHVEWRGTRASARDVEQFMLDQGRLQ